MRGGFVAKEKLSDRKAKVFQMPRVQIQDSDLGIFEWEQIKEMEFIREFLGSKKNLLDNIDEKTFKSVRFFLDMYTPLKKRIASMGAELVTNAWLKIYEILGIFGNELVRPLEDGKDGFSFFDACSLPGAFSSAINHYIRTLRLDDIKQVDWKAESLWNIEGEEFFGDDYGLVKANPDNFDFGSTGTGDITQEENIRYFRKKYGGRDLYISDCGIDVSADFNRQESLNGKLNCAQVLLGMSLIRKGGSVVFKTYTSFEASSISLRLILSSKFKKFYVVKPLTSRPGNSETYMVGIDFKGASEEFFTRMFEFLAYLDPENPETMKSGIVPQDKIPPKWLESHLQISDNLTHQQVDILDRFYKYRNGVDSKQQKLFWELKGKACNEWLKINTVSAIEDEWRLVPPEGN